jgi:hypothetical protein
MFYKQCGSYRIPILEEHESLTDEHVKLIEEAIQSDGCTIVSELYHECCVVHDLGYQFAIDPWGRQVTKGQIDTAYRQCMEQRSKLGRYNPISWMRYLGVRAFGRFFRKSKAGCE